MTAPFVSIGMPVFNGQIYLREALESVLNQTFKDFELIISDNASTDCTESICREYVAKDPRITYVRQHTNIGATKNFFYLLDRASGDYFFWAAADDMRDNNWLETLVCAILPTDVVVQSSVYIGKHLSSASAKLAFDLPCINKNDRFTVFMQDERLWRSIYIYGLFDRQKLIGANLKTVANDFWAAETMLYKLVSFGSMRPISGSLFFYRDNPTSQGKDEAKKYSSTFRRVFFPVRFNYIAEIFQASPVIFKFFLIFLVPIKQGKVVFESFLRLFNCK